MHPHSSEAGRAIAEQEGQRTGRRSPGTPRPPATSRHAMLIAMLFLALVVLVAILL
jgi:hypothetical protein